MIIKRTITFLIGVFSITTCYIALAGISCPNPSDISGGQVWTGTTTGTEQIPLTSNSPSSGPQKLPDKPSVFWGMIPIGPTGGPITQLACIYGSDGNQYLFSKTDLNLKNCKLYMNNKPINLNNGCSKDYGSVSNANQCVLTCDK